METAGAAVIVVVAMKRGIGTLVKAVFHTDGSGGRGGGETGWARGLTHADYSVTAHLKI